MSRRIGSSQNLIPNYIANLLWMQVSLNTLMVYIQGQNNFPLEGFSGDNISNTLWTAVNHTCIPQKKWACCSQVRWAGKTGWHWGLPLVSQGTLSSTATGDMIVLSGIQFLSTTCSHVLHVRKSTPALDRHGFKLWAPTSHKLGQLRHDQNSPKKSKIMQ